MLFFDEVDPTEIPSLYAQCDIGLVVLDARHKSHNIPGKFLTYMQSGLPVLAAVNPGNDLIELVTDSIVGRACSANDPDNLFNAAQELLLDVRIDAAYQERCRALSDRLFTAKSAARQVVDSLQGEQP